VSGFVVLLLCFALAFRFRFRRLPWDGVCIVVVLVCVCGMFRCCVSLDVCACLWEVKRWCVSNQQGQKRGRIAHFSSDIRPGCVNVPRLTLALPRVASELTLFRVMILPD